MERGQHPPSGAGPYPPKGTTRPRQKGPAVINGSLTRFSQSLETSVWIWGSWDGDLAPERRGTDSCRSALLPGERAYGEAQCLNAGKLFEICIKSLAVRR